MMVLAAELMVLVLVVLVVVGLWWGQRWREREGEATQRWKLIVPCLLYKNAKMMGVLRQASIVPRKNTHTNTYRISITNSRPNTIPNPLPITPDLRKDNAQVS